MMKRITFLLVNILVSCMIANAQTNEMWQRAESDATGGRYKEAFERLHGIEQAIQTNASLDEKGKAAARYRSSLIRMNMYMKKDGRRYFVYTDVPSAKKYVEIGGEINRLNHRRNDDALMLDGQRPKDWKAIVCHSLILNCTPNEHIIISIAPVFGNAFHESVYALGEEIEQQILPYLHHLPALGSPRISIFQ